MTFTPNKSFLWVCPLIIVVLIACTVVAFLQKQWVYMALYTAVAILLAWATPLTFQKLVFKENELILKVPYKKFSRIVSYQNITCVYVVTMKKGCRTIGKGIVLYEKEKEHQHKTRSTLKLHGYLTRFKHTPEREAFIKQHFADRLRYATVDAKTGEKTEKQAP